MLQKQYRMHKSSEYKRVFANGKSYTSKHVVIYLFRGQTRYGFIASKKIGGSVKRNRAKRLMREIVRLNLDKIKKDFQIIFIARTAIVNASFAEVKKSIFYVLRKAGVLDEHS